MKCFVDKLVSKLEKQIELNIQLLQTLSLTEQCEKEEDHHKNIR
jgi:hypothetical protein